MKNSQPFNSLTDNKESIINAHLRADMKKRRKGLQTESTPWLAYTALIAVVVVMVIVIGEYLV